MPPLLRTVLLIGVMFVAAIAGITFFATEGPEVVVLLTRGENGTPRKTRVWVADADGATWIESATPDREFLADIRRNPMVQLERYGELRPYLARALPGPEGHDRIRALLREKYGWADWWLQQIVDTSQSVGVRLETPKSFMAPRH